VNRTAPPPPGLRLSLVHVPVFFPILAFLPPFCSLPSSSVFVAGFLGPFRVGLLVGPGRSQETRSSDCSRWSPGVPGPSVVRAAVQTPDGFRGSRPARTPCPRQPPPYMAVIRFFDAQGRVSFPRTSASSTPFPRFVFFFFSRRDRVFFSPPPPRFEWSCSLGSSLRPVLSPPPGLLVFRIFHFSVFFKAGRACDLVSP